MGQETAGVVFHVMDDDIARATDATYKGKAILHAVVEDLDLWEKVIEQLNGMELHRGRNFKDELLEVLRRRNSELEQTAEQIADDRDSTIQHLLQQVDQAQQAQAAAEQNQRLADAKVAVLDEELTSLREAKAAMDALAQM